MTIDWSPDITVKDIDAEEVLLREGAHDVYHSGKYKIINCNYFDNPVRDCADYIWRKVLNKREITLVYTGMLDINKKPTQTDIDGFKAFLADDAATVYKEYLLRYLHSLNIKIYRTKDISINDILNCLANDCVKELIITINAFELANKNKK